jgi:hypothetical protein
VAPALIFKDTSAAAKAFVLPAEDSPAVRGLLLKTTWVVPELLPEPLPLSEPEALAVPEPLTLIELLLDPELLLVALPELLLEPEEETLKELELFDLLLSEEELFAEAEASDFEEPALLALPLEDAWTLQPTSVTPMTKAMTRGGVSTR